MHKGPKGDLPALFLETQMFTFGGFPAFMHLGKPSSSSLPPLNFFFLYTDEGHHADMLTPEARRALLFNCKKTKHASSGTSTLNELQHKMHANLTVLAQFYLVVLNNV